MGPISGTLSIFGQEKQVFLREYSNNYYGLSSYLFSKVIVEVTMSLRDVKRCLMRLLYFHHIASFSNTPSLAVGHHWILERGLSKHGFEILYSSGSLGGFVQLRR
jgi:hypothetical protein